MHARIRTHVSGTDTPAHLRTLITSMSRLIVASPRDPPARHIVILRRRNAPHTISIDVASFSLFLSRWKKDDEENNYTGLRVIIRTARKMTHDNLGSFYAIFPFNFFFFFFLHALLRVPPRSDRGESQSAGVPWRQNTPRVRRRCGLRKGRGLFDWGEIQIANYLIRPTDPQWATTRQAWCELRRGIVPRLSSSLFQQFSPGNISTTASFTRDTRSTRADVRWNNFAESRDF